MENGQLSKIEIGGYYPGVVGRITELHAVYYYEKWGFDISFETQVGKELSEFLINFEEQRDYLWVCKYNDNFVGSIVIDGHLASTEGGRLRWFLVDPEFQGMGIGKTLIQKAIDFCKRAGFRKVFLWTFEGLDAARLLYEREGFRRTEEHEIYQWGKIIREQKFELDLSCDDGNRS